MQIKTFDIPGLVLFQPKVFGDHRGYFVESYNKEKVDKVLGDVNFVQDNESMSSYGVIRGLHFQKPPFAQAKLVRCVMGTVLDVAVDLRKSSPTYGQHVAVELSGENKHQFFVPRGFAHGFAVLSETAIFAYKVDGVYAPDYEGGLDVFDPTLNIDWRINKAQANISGKDKELALFDQYVSDFE